MCRKISCILLITIVFLLAGCNSTENQGTDAPNAPAPRIVIDGKDYYARDLYIVEELPAGYEYAGELSEEELKYAHIDGKKYYVDKRREALYDFYVYQECGTPISEKVVDSTKRQWAYVRWSMEEASYIVNTFEETPTELIEEYFEASKMVTRKTYYEMSDGTWKTDEYSYKYRLEITGRLNNAKKDSTYVILSNTETITFEQAWKASGLSSLESDYFDEKDAKIVAIK